MATWVQTGVFKLNLDAVAMLIRQANGDLLVMFPGGQNHMFKEPAAERVGGW